MMDTQRDRHRSFPEPCHTSVLSVTIAGNGCDRGYCGGALCRGGRSKADSNVSDQYTNATSDRFLKSADYFNLNNVQIGYTLPKQLSRKFACNNLTISAFVRNPFYIYRSLKLFDAEATDGTNWIYQAQIGGTTATARSFGMTLRASF